MIDRQHDLAQRIVFEVQRLITGYDRYQAESMAEVINAELAADPTLKQVRHALKQAINKAVDGRCADEDQLAEALAALERLMGESK